jgi:diguanylate cyclase (GGDEF)-like protein/PAS domain S-box-containing protein
MPPQKTTRPRKDEDRTRALFNAFQEAILIHDPETGAILDANARACSLFGYAQEELLALPMGNLSVGLAPYTQEDALAWIRKAAQGSPQTFEWLAHDCKGRIFWVEMNLHLATLDGAPRILSTVRDIRDRKRLESDHKTRLKRAEAQNVVFLALAEAGSNFQRALDLIARYLAADIGDLAVVELMDDRGRLFPHAVDQPYMDGTDLLPNISALNTATPLDSIPARVAASGTPLRLEDSKGARILESLRPEFHPFLRRYNAHSILAVPLRSQGVTLGTLTLAKGSASRPYSEEDQTMLQNLADRAGLALTNAKLFSENLQQAEQLRRANVELEARVAARTAELEQLNQRLKQMAIEDALTGLANRRRFNEVMDEEIRRARRGKKLFTLLMCDVDFFKRYNDHYGHQGGDDCLRAVGEIMREVFRRAGELPVRYGGEEFAVILPGVNQESGLKAAEKLLKALAERAIPHARSDAAAHVSLSIGLISARVEQERDADWFIARADAALYQSKEDGRNRATAARM